MKHRIDLTGDYETTIYAVARRLLDRGAAADDTVETWRDGKLSMSGVIGELARWTVAERKSGGLRLVRYVPFPRDAVARVAGKSDVLATIAAPGEEGAPAP
jgi:hypothetical protein